jgi:hypothetical protein
MQAFLGKPVSDPRQLRWLPQHAGVAAVCPPSRICCVRNDLQRHGFGEASAPASLQETIGQRPVAASTARAWLIGSNPQLEDLAPIEVFHEGQVDSISRRDV